jgi:hypothetical protein
MNVLNRHFQIGIDSIPVKNTNVLITTNDKSIGSPEFPDLSKSLKSGIGSPTAKPPNIYYQEISGKMFGNLPLQLKSNSICSSSYIFHRQQHIS